LYYQKPCFSQGFCHFNLVRLLKRSRWKYDRASRADGWYTAASPVLSAALAARFSEVARFAGANAIRQ
jgi:hypothetical protein